MIKEAIETVVNGRSLTFEQAAAVMEEIMIGEATQAQVAAFVTSLRIKGETVDEIAGLATIMQARATLIHILELQIKRRKQAVEDIKRYAFKNYWQA